MEKRKKHFSTITAVILLFVPAGLCRAQAHIMISSGTTLSLGSSFMRVSGNWSNGGTLNAGTGTIVFAGSGDQTIGNSAGETFYNLVISNPGGNVLLEDNTTIEGTLSFLSGNILAGSTDLTISGSVSGAGPGKCVVIDGSGQVVRSLSASESFDFPVASTTSSFNPLTLTLGPAEPSELFAVFVRSGVTPGAPDNATTVQRTWTISEGIPGGNSAQLKFQWTDAEEGGSFNRSDAAVWRYQSPNWIFVDAITLAGSDPFTGETILTNVSPAGSYLIGNSGGLPVQMSGFTATASRLNSDLRWRTETEVENYGFEVERRVVSREYGVSSKEEDGMTNQRQGESTNQRQDETTSQWAKIGFVPGAGTSSSPKEYSFADKNVTPGRYVYRIKQIDQSGAFAYTAAIELEVGLAPLEFNLAQNYPNPFNPTTTIEFTLPQDGRVLLKIYDLQGREVVTLVDEERKAGIHHEVMFDASRLASGMYFSRLQSGNHQAVKKMVLVK